MRFGGLPDGSRDDVADPEKRGVAEQEPGITLGGGEIQSSGRDVLQGARD